MGLGRFRGGGLGLIGARLALQRCFEAPGRHRWAASLGIAAV